jgi:hypothetical protein
MDPDSDHITRFDLREVGGLKRFVHKEGVSESVRGSGSNHIEPSRRNKAYAKR